jgi:hypothetical protein
MIVFHPGRSVFNRQPNPNPKQTMPYTNNVTTPPSGRINPESAAQIMISVVGKLLGRPEVLTRGQRDIPPVRRVLIFFEGADGIGQITGCDLFAKDSPEPLESDDAETLLETRIPVVEGMDPMPIGRLLDDAVLTLLALRQLGGSGWSEGAGVEGGAGSRGQADIRWQSQPNGEILTSVGGSLRSR